MILCAVRPASVTSPVGPRAAGAIGTGATGFCGELQLVRLPQEHRAIHIVFWRRTEYKPRSERQTINLLASPRSDKEGAGDADETGAPATCVSRHVGHSTKTLFLNMDSPVCAAEARYALSNVGYIGWARRQRLVAERALPFADLASEISRKPLHADACDRRYPRLLDGA